MICAVKDGAWLIQTLSIAGLDQRGTFGVLGSDADKGILTGIAGNVRAKTFYSAELSSKRA
jgi:hypothetical protein